MNPVRVEFLDFLDRGQLASPAADYPYRPLRNTCESFAEQSFASTTGTCPAPAVGNKVTGGDLKGKANLQ